MKRIFFDRNGGMPKPYHPFWQPWGCWGCLWRTLVFLLGMLLIALLLMWMRGCSNGGRYDSFDRDSDMDLERYYGWDHYKDNDSDKDRDNGRDKDRDKGRDFDYEKLPVDGPVRNEPYKPIDEIPPYIYDDQPVKEWNDSIPGVHELPKPKDNYLPPLDSSKIVPSPDDSLLNIIADQIIVLFNSRDVKGDMASFAQQFKRAYPGNDYAVIYYNPTAGTMLLQVPPELVLDMLTDIPRHITGIDYKLTTNPLIEMESKPSDPEFGQIEYDRYFEAIQAFDAWDITKGNQNVVVGIVDCYFCLDNPEINSRYIKPIHIPTKTTNVLPRTMPMPPFSNIRELEVFVAQCHGTHVASIAVGSHDNGNGTGGIAPNCQWIPISVGNKVPFIYIMEGILYAIYQGADVVNVSMGMNFPENIDKMLTLPEQAERTKDTFVYQEDVWEFIYQTACDHNCIICTAAGNDNIIMGMDAAKRSKLAVKVEATTPDGTSKADFSSFGTVPRLEMDLSTVSAPGEDILGGVAWGKSFEMSGTSQATPFVTGTIALMKSINKNITPEQVVDILIKTGKPLSASNRVGPLIQIRDALTMVQEGIIPEKMMEYNDVINNHNNIIGRWQGTEPQILADVLTNEPIEEIITYMEFTSVNRGFVEFQAQQSRRVYKAPLSVAWGSNSITITQQGDAICITDSSDKIVHYDYECKPDSNGLMDVTVMKGSTKHINFNMRKIR